MSGLPARLAELGDPLRYRLPTMRRVTWYPLGCPLSIETNSDEVLEAAGSVWGHYPAAALPLSARLIVDVSTEHVETAQSLPVTLGQEHLISIVDSAANFAVADLNRGFAAARLSANAILDRRFLLDGFLEPLAYLMLGARHFVMVHAACVVLHGRAILLCGDSGAGKTCLAYACARLGWSFLSGDAAQIVRGSTPLEVVGRPYTIRFRESAQRLFPELAALPASIRGAKIDVEAGAARLGLRPVLRATVERLIFLNRVAGADGAEIAGFDRDLALALLDRTVFYGDERVRLEQRRTLRELVKLPVARLTYSDPGAAERRLREVVGSR
ncbi:MAG: hypothetical protein KGN84_03255 [Acidobacteriota bacterium]|nr:hypothetical protein [Acidobacteriota bacterium]